MDDLLARPDDWDIANISLASYDDLDKLDQAGLLYDFNHDPFWATRDTDWPVPMGVYSDDGRLIAIPYGRRYPMTQTGSPIYTPILTRLSLSIAGAWIWSCPWPMKSAGFSPMNGIMTASSIRPIPRGYPRNTVTLSYARRT